MVAVLFFSCHAMAEKQVFYPIQSDFLKYDILDCRTGKFVSAKEFEKAVLENDVIYSLESHNIIAHHELQRELARLLFRNNFPNETVLAHEFFIKNCYNHQNWLNKLYKKEITMDEFLDAVKYTMDRTKELTPIFKIIASETVKPLALSIPMPLPGEIIPEFTVTLKNLREKIFDKNWPDDQKMFPSQEMLDENYKNLTEGEKSFLPRDGFKILCSKNLHEFLLPSFKMGHGRITPEECHLSYWLMNEIMAHSIMECLDANPGYKMVVGAGINHGIFKSGIRSSVAARKPELKQLTVFPAMNEDFSANNEFIKHAVECGLADYILAPKKKCGKNEISLSLPQGDFNLLSEGTFGKENLTRSLVEGGISEEEALKAIGGLIEDKFICFTDAEMNFFIIIKTVLDTEKDAEEFFDAYAKMTTNTMGERRVIDGKLVWETDGFKRIVERVGVCVEINAEMIVE